MRPALLAVALAAAACLTLTAAPLHAADDAPTANTLRIGVVRLQEVVERYHRYSYVTARFTEEFRKRSNAALAEKKAIEDKIQDMQANTNPEQVMFDPDAREKAFKEQADLTEKDLDIEVKISDLTQMKQDLNTVMSLQTMQDIEDAVKRVAAPHHFDYVTDYLPVESARKQLAHATSDNLDQGMGLMIENLQNRAPTLYANPDLDITDAVVAQLNAEYDTTYASGKTLDPLLTDPLEKITASLAQMRAAFEAAKATADYPSLAPPQATGYPYGVVNLQKVVQTMLQSRKYDVDFEKFGDDLHEQGSEIERHQEVYKSHVQDIENDVSRLLPVSPQMRQNLLDMKKELDSEMIQAVTAKLKAEAIYVYTWNKMLAQISAMTRQQAQKNGIQLVVATFSADDQRQASAVQGAIEGKNMVVWYRTGKPGLDLTQAVIDGLDAQYQNYLADIARKGLKPNPFDLDQSEDQTMLAFRNDLKKASDEQAADDANRFKLWHTFQKNVLHQQPIEADATPAKADATPAKTDGPKVVQPDPVPVATTPDPAPQQAPATNSDPVPTPTH
ncbi:MAG: OmpH family outer membrane protein [Planctomycetota bacterium]